MKPNLPKLLTFFLVCCSRFIFAQEIWTERFNISEKGIWGQEADSIIYVDFEDIDNWTLEYSNVLLIDSDDYAKTVSTSGGRFECRDINGEVIWRSKKIGISDFKNVSIELLASETGSGANVEKKYLKAYYILDSLSEQTFEEHSENVGNWGTNMARQGGLEGDTVQIVVRMNNHYASEKVILDEIFIRGEEKNPVIINEGDVVINEILFDPVVGGEDYVEVFNRSPKEIPLNRLFLASRDKYDELTQIYPITSERKVLYPNEYLVLTKDTNGVFPWYTILKPDRFIQMERFPSFNNDKDVVVLLDQALQIVDEFRYTEKMHAPFLKDKEGVSLERVSPDLKTGIFTNWHSASTESGYGTPGYKNSQFSAEDQEGINVSFEPDAFSPNSDGYNDEYTISYSLNKTGYYANISVFDANGRYIRHIAKNEILGTIGKYCWNGEDETGDKQDLGVYVVLVEIYDLVGNIHRFKDGIVLTDILE